MLFSIHCLDYPDKSQLRQEHYTDHRAHLNNATVTLVLAGPIAADDGATPIGSVFIVDAPDRAAVEAFNRADPFYRLGVWDTATLQIHPFLKRRGWLAGY